MKKNKVFIIGIDGGNFEVIKPLLKKGELPNIKKLIDKGVSDTLYSSIHPSTEQAWPSFMTGCNNGKHGIFGYVYRKKDRYEFGIVNGSFIKKESLWEILSKYNKKSIVINVPLTYPPKKINGILVSCFFAPSKSSNYTYPNEIKHLIDKITPDYVLENVTPSIEAIRDKQVIDKFLKKVDTAIKNRGILTRYFMDNYEWDLFVTVFTCTDGIQHRFWDCMKKKDVYSDVIFKTYKKIDDEIGTYLSRLDNNTTVFLISDHGFCELKRHVMIGNWLKNKGYLVTRASFFHDFKVKLFYRLFHFLPYGWDNKIGEKFKKSVVSSMNLKNVLWDKTKAYAVGSGNICINLKGREPQGCVDKLECEQLRTKLIKELKQLKDPDTGKCVIKPLKREEVYHGEFLQDAPDIIVFPEDGYKTGLLKPSLFTKGKVLPESKKFGKGSHSYKGIFIASGKNIKKIKVSKPLSLIDITPTVLYLLGVPLPKHIDGRVIKELIVSSPRKINKKCKESEKDLLNDVISKMGGV